MNNRARIESDNGNLAFYSPYDAAMLNEFKGRIPAADRRWDGSRKCWLVAAQHLGALEHLCDRYDLTVVKQLQTLYDAPAVVQRILEIRYIGAPKERADGTVTAMGNVNGDWSVVFPQDVLRGWFEIGNTAAAAPSASTTCYGVLAVARDADPAAIKAAYRSMAKRWHPDVNRDPDATEMFKRIGRAWEILGDPAKRRRYDAGLALEATLEATLGNARPQLPDMFVWRPPLRCGLLLVEGTERLGRLIVSKIHVWQPIIGADGRELVTSWPAGADHWQETWI